MNVLFTRFISNSRHAVIFNNSTLLKAHLYLISLLPLLQINQQSEKERAKEKRDTCTKIRE